MRNIFLVNPKAGQGNNIDHLINHIERTSKKFEKEGKDVTVEVYVTNFTGDAEEYTRKVTQETEGREEVRFYACGGDGTLNEVVNGAYGYDHVAVGVVPVGTGNDFVRNFGEVKDFLDIKKQLEGIDKPVDLIEFSGVIDGKAQSRYCINMFNIGFDCNVVDRAAELKKKPLIKGSAAYLLSVGSTLINKDGANLRISINKKTVHEGPLLLAAIANGSYCGGGIYSSPQAKVDDGKMDVNIIENVSRAKFVSLFPKYKEGTHFELPGIENTVHAYACKNATIEPLTEDGTMRLCTDGEISTVGKIEMNVLHKSIKVVLPL